ncbi:MAG: hypothetical protein M1820_009722 [Bogoriella megaspora]|nr:MAG: hypothetical protein M1820_009722 [Bogoriella megaspora]
MFLPSSGPPTLRIKRPTPTTVLFTVSTASPSDTLLEKALLYVSHLIRVSVIVLALISCLTKSQYQPVTVGAPSHNRLLESRVGQAVLPLVKDVDWIYLLPAALLILWLAVRRGYTAFRHVMVKANTLDVEESLLVLRGLGVQTSSSSPVYLVTAQTKFIPTTMIQDIFIHEAFKGFEVRYYLSIVVEGEEDVVVVFPVRY